MLSTFHVWRRLTFELHAQVEGLLRWSSTQSRFHCLALLGPKPKQFLGGQGCKISTKQWFVTTQEPEQQPGGGSPWSAFKRNHSWSTQDNFRGQCCHHCAPFCSLSMSLKMNHVSGRTDIAGRRQRLKGWSAEFTYQVFSFSPKTLLVSSINSQAHRILAGGDLRIVDEILLTPSTAGTGVWTAALPPESVFPAFPYINMFAHTLHCRYSVHFLHA